MSFSLWGESLFSKSFRSPWILQIECLLCDRQPFARREFPARLKGRKTKTGQSQLHCLHQTHFLYPPRPPFCSSCVTWFSSLAFRLQLFLFFLSYLLLLLLSLVLFKAAGSLEKQSLLSSRIKLLQGIKCNGD